MAGIDNDQEVRWSGGIAVSVKKPVTLRFSDDSTTPNSPDYPAPSVPMPILSASLRPLDGELPSYRAKPSNEA